MPRIELKDATSRSFDYVVIGGGTAGLALAARLTENTEISVLVLEAGEENLNDPLILNIGQYGHTLGQKEYDWCSTTTPQVNANNAVFRWSRGRALGGSSAVNFTAWNKPSKEDIDGEESHVVRFVLYSTARRAAWEKLGNEGWNWDRFDKYMQRATTYTPPDLAEIERTGRSAPDLVRELWREPVGNGPIQVSHPPLPIDIDVKAQQTFQNLGIPMAPAPLDGDPNGVVIGPVTIDPKTILRSFAGNAYWEPNSARPGFNLLTGAVVQRLVTTEIDGELVVTGVEFSHKAGGDEIYTAKSSKEIILSAGTLLTPQILELSGIGRPDVLQKVGIPIKLALEGVGENVQDHILSSVVFPLKDGVPVETFDTLRDPEEAKRHKELFTKGKGLYTAGVENLLFAPLSSLSDKTQGIISDTRKRIEAEIASGKYSPELAEQYIIQLNKLENKVPSCEIIGFPVFFGGANPPVPGRLHYSVLCSANSLFSRGTIHVTTSDAKVQPAMDPHYFEQEIDLQILREIMKFGRKVGNTAPLKDYFDETLVELNPGSDVSTDEELSDYLRRNVSECFHTIGSASMLPREKGGVVDTRLKVYGTKNLRVADLSIVPLHFGSHSQSVAYGIGEIAADIIKGLA
ncbi:GMC oxidoreductase [Macrolepiota fuliginosa MF-IS2]|uniref:pyranose dehydrogenase (acceptor) n=1 Tax=Macrolepiota fuliginosa MF-IS2 TaxID=1400762 RepID=A0A9P5XBF9_9AGAR|nr:GMC oxidoreductase [Macrolepiota fuliginosa MF-IS2]